MHVIQRVCLFSVSSILCPSHYSCLICFSSFHPINPFLESLGLTVCEGIANNVVTAHLAQPHLKLPRVVRSWCGRIEKRKKISQPSSRLLPLQYIPLRIYFFQSYNTSPIATFVSRCRLPYAQQSPILHLVVRVFLACLRVFCIRNAASPTGSVLPRSFPPPRSGRPRGSRTPQGDH